MGPPPPPEVLVGVAPPKPTSSHAPELGPWLIPTAQLPDVLHVTCPPEVLIICFTVKSTPLNAPLASVKKTPEAVLASQSVLLPAAHISMVKGELAVSPLPPTLIDAPSVRPANCESVMVPVPPVVPGPAAAATPPIAASTTANRPAPATAPSTRRPLDLSSIPAPHLAYASPAKAYGAA